MSRSRPRLLRIVGHTPRVQTSTEVITAVRNYESRLNKIRSASVQSHVAQPHKKANNEAWDWHETVQVGIAFEDRLDEIVQVLEPKHKMWDGHLGQMFGVEHCVDLVPDLQAAHIGPVSRRHRHA